VSQTRSIWPVLVASSFVILVLCGLGAWQLQRLAHKQALLDEIGRRALADPVELSEAIKLQQTGKNIEFMKVWARGRFLHDAEKHMIAALDGNPAWEVVTPLITTYNVLILVVRGLVPDEKRNSAKRAEGNPAGEVEIAGIIINNKGKRGLFTPDNDIKGNMWFWWDVPAMLASTAAPPGASPALFVLHVMPVAGEKDLPRPAVPRAALRNNHLQYAITWFSLALVLAVIAGLFIRGQMKKSGA
jgi:surfeit locus 1 family protein